MRIFVLFGALLVACLPTLASNPAPLHFEQNIGQADPAVSFFARTGKATVFFAEKQTVYSLRGNGKQEANVFVSYPQSSPSAVWQGEARQQLLISSFVGDRERWKQNIPSFGRMVRKGIYPGVDLVYYGSSQELEYDFLLNPGADPNKIRLRFEGITNARINPNGDLELATAAGTLVQKRPRLFQDGKELEGRFILHSPNEAGFTISAYDATKPLRIDPVVTFASFYGGEGTDAITSASSNTFVGYTNSIVFPGSSIKGAGGYDAFLMTVGALPRLIFVGGSKDDRGLGLWAGNPDTFGSIPTTGAFSFALVGETESEDFPRFYSNSLIQESSVLPSFSVSPLRVVRDQPFAGGGTDGFIFHYNFGGEVFSLLVGGSGADRLLGVGAVTSNIYEVVGETNSPDLGGRLGFLPQPRGGTDGILARLNHGTGGTPVWTAMSYWGGTGEDSLTSVTTWNGYSVVAGTTSSDDLPVLNAIQPARAGGKDAFLIINPIFERNMTLATYFGGSGDDTVAGVSADTQRGLLLAGTTNSRDLPLRNPSQSKYGGGESDAFWAAFTGFPAGPTQLQQASYWGGSGEDVAHAVANGRLTASHSFSGSTNSRDFPLLFPLQDSFRGGATDAWVAQVSLQRGIRFSTYYGGTGDDEGKAIGVSETGEILLAGTTTSPTLAGLQLPKSYAFGGGTDAFVATLNTDNIFVNAPNIISIDTVSEGRFTRAALTGRTKQLRVTSSNSDKLLISWLPSQVGQRDLETEWNGEPLSIYLHGVADSGDAELIASAEGMQEWRETFTLKPLKLRPQLIYENSGNQLPTAADGRFTWKIEAVDVALHFSAEPEGYRSPIDSVSFPRPGITPLPVSITGVSQDLLRIKTQTRETFSRPSPSLRVATLAALAPGTADLRVQVGSHPETLVPLTLERYKLGFGSGFSASIAPISAPSKIVAVALAYDAFAPLPPTLRLTALNAATGLSGSITAPPRATLEIATSQFAARSVQIFVHHLDPSQDVAFSAEAAGVSSELRMAPGSLELLAFPSPATVGVQSSASVTLFASRSQPPLTVQRINAFSIKPIRFRIDNPNPDLISLLENEMEIAPGTSFGLINYRMLVPGRAQLVLTAIEDPNISPFTATFTGVAPAAPPAPKLEIFTNSKLGKDLQQPARLDVPSNFRGTITLTSSDPTKLLLAPDAVTTGQATLRFTDGLSRPFYIHALADSGQATILASAEGLQSHQVSIQLSRSLLSFNKDRQQIESNAQRTELAIRLSQDGESRNDWPSILTNRFFPYYAYTLYAKPRRPNYTPTFQVVSSNTAVGVVQESAGSWSFTPRQAGETTLRLSSQTVPVNDAASTSQITVADPPFRINWRNEPLGKDLSRFADASFPNVFNSTKTFTWRTSDPSKLLLDGQATTNSLPGAMVRLDALSDSGTVLITVSDGTQETDFRVHLCKSQLMLFSGLPASGLYDPTIRLLAGNALPLTVRLQGIERSPNSVYDLARPGLAPIRFSLASSNSQTVAPLSDLVLPSSGFLDMTVASLAPGTTNLRVTVPADSADLVGSSSSLDVEARRLSFTLPPAAVGFGGQVQLNVVAQGEANLRTPITITSSDPAKVRLAIVSEASINSRTDTGAASVTISQKSGSILVKALDYEGPVALTVASDGYEPLTVPITLRKSAIFPFFENSGLQQGQLLPGQTPYRVGVLLEGNQSINLAGKLIPLRLVSEDPSIVSVETPSISFPSQFFFSVQARRPGRTVLRIVTEEPGFTVLTQLPAEVVLPRLPVSLNTTIAQNSITQGFIGNASTAPFPVKITSGDPSRLLIANSVSQEGSPSATATRGEFYLQALGDSGRVELLLEADGYAQQLFEISLVPSALAFNAVGFAIKAQESIATSVSLFSVNPTTGQIESSKHNIRPGLRLQASVDNSNPAVLSVSPATFHLDNLTSEAILQVQGILPGAARLTLVQPAGLQSPRERATLDFTVTPSTNAKFTVSPFMSKGLYYLCALEVPGDTFRRATLRSSDPSRLLLSAQPTSPPSAELNVVPLMFFAHVLSDSGTVTITATNDVGLSISATVQLGPLGIGFQAMPSTLAPGAVARPTIRLYALKSDLSLAPMDGAFGLREGVTIVANVTTSDPSVISVTDSSALLFGSSKQSHQFAITGQRAGTARLRVVPSSGIVSTQLAEALVTVGSATGQASGQPK